MNSNNLSANSKKIIKILWKNSKKCYNISVREKIILVFFLIMVYSIKDYKFRGEIKW